MSTTAAEKKDTNDEKSIVAAIKKVKSETADLVSGSKLLQALQKAISYVPRTRKEDIKQEAIDNAIGVFELIKDGSIKKYVGELSEEELDSCLKYVYKGMASGGKEICPKLLKWHGFIVDKAGQGCICRVLTDYKF